MDLILCEYLNPHQTQWASTGLVGQISSKRILKGNHSFLNIHWIGHATISLNQISKIHIPILLTAHDEWWLHDVSHYSQEPSFESDSLMKRQILKSIRRKKEKVLKMPNLKIVCLSQEMLEKFLSVHPYLSGRVRVIPNPVDDSVFHPLKSKEYFVDVPAAGYLGGFSDTRKGYDLLLETLEQCHERFNVLVPGIEEEILSGARQQIRIIGIPKILNENEMNKIFFCLISKLLLLSLLSSSRKFEPIQLNYPTILALLN
jgi:glycosyltransferase involved in cell wall biosynthesis